MCVGFTILAYCMLLPGGAHLGDLETLIFALLFLPTLVLPGILYIVFARSMQQRRKWAVVTVTVLAWLHAAGCLLLLILVAKSIVVGSLVIISAAAMLLVAALLIYYCKQSFPIVGSASWNKPRGPRGFEPIIADPKFSASSAFPLPPKSLKGSSQSKTDSQ